MKISVIIPTITGREESLDRAVTAYKERSSGAEIEIITVKDYPTWPAGCNAARPRATGEYHHYTADDLEPLDGWVDAMLRCIGEGFIPAPQMWNHVYEGVPTTEQWDGPPGTFCRLARIPTLPKKLVEEMGPWPEAIHYYSDNWVSDKAALLGWRTRVTEGYNFIHHWHPVGRLDKGDWMGRYLPLYNQEREKLGLGRVDY